MEYRGALPLYLKLSTANLTIMKSNIQQRKEELRREYKDNGELPTIRNGYDYIAIVFKEKDENGNNYFTHIDANSDKDEIMEFLRTPVKDILRLEEWYAGINKGGVEYTTDAERYCEETINTLR